jgi:hypothetical protein
MNVEPGSNRPSAPAVIWLAALLLGLACFVFVGALPPFGFGIWYQTEPVTILAVAAGATAAVLLAWAAFGGMPVATALAHPAALFTGLLALVTLLLAPLAPFPMRSLFGPPETGEGGLWFAALAPITALALLVWPHHGPRTLVQAMLFVAFASLVAFSVVPQPGSGWRPGKWIEYLGYIGPYAALAFLPLVVGRHRWPGPALATLIALIAVGLSQNRTAMILLGAGLATAGSLWLAERRLAPRLLRRLALVATVGLPLAVALSFQFLTPVASDFSVQSRSLLTLVGVAAITADPTMLLHGQGWGGYNDLLLAHALLDGVSLYEAGAWKPSWEALGGGAFHSHNAYLEAVLALGVVGGALYAASMTSAPLWAASRGWALSVGLWVTLAGLAVAWFPLAHILPFQAVALAATAGGVASGRRFGGSARRPWAVALPVLALALVLAVGVADMVRTTRAGGAVIDAAKARRPVEASPDPRALDDRGRGGTHLWWVAVNMSSYIASQLERRLPVTELEVAWFDRLREAMDQRVAAGEAGLRLRSVALSYRNDLIVAFGGGYPAFDRLRRLWVPGWREKVLTLLEDMPERSDFAVPILTWMMVTGDEPSALALADEILARLPNDRVGLWYSGLVMLGRKESEAEGLKRVVRAVDAGIERVFPINEALKNLVAAERTRMQGGGG